MRRYGRELALDALRGHNEEVLAPLYVRDYLLLHHTDCRGWHPMLHSHAMKAFLATIKEARA